MTSGGIALKFFASVRLEIRSIGKIKSVSLISHLLLRMYKKIQISVAHSSPNLILCIQRCFRQKVMKMSGFEFASEYKRVR